MEKLAAPLGLPVHPQHRIAPAHEPCLLDVRLFRDAVHHCEPHPGRKVVVVEFEAPGLALLALEEDVEGRRGVRHDPERDRLRRELRERGILLSLAVDLS